MTGLHIAVGGVTSCTVTVALQVDTFPWLSVSVRVTVLSPTSIQSNELGDTSVVAIPLGSIDPKAIASIFADVKE